MFLMDFKSIRGEDLPYYDKNTTWDILHEHIDAHSQRLFDGFPRDRL